MSLIHFNQNRFPWVPNGRTNWLDADGFVIDDFFATNINLPAMNLKEKKDKIELELAVPGFSKKDIEVTMDNNVLCISGNNKSQNEKEEEGYIRKDFNYSSFERKIKLPQEVDQKHIIEATYKDGVLKLALHKKQETTAQQKQIIAIQ